MKKQTVIPLFPLGIVVVPGEDVPLHIFEPRYREMVADCRANGEPFGIVNTQDGKLHTIGCTVTICQIIHAHDNGELDILTQGQERFIIRDVLRDKSYFQAWIDYLHDESDEDVEERLRHRVLGYFQRLGKVLDLAVPDPTHREAQLSFVLAGMMDLERPLKLQLLNMTRESDRLELLGDYLQTVVPQMEQAKEFRRRVKSNGHFTQGLGAF